MSVFLSRLNRQGHWRRHDSSKNIIEINAYFFKENDIRDEKDISKGKF